MKAAVIEDEMSHRMLLCEKIRKWGLDTKEPVSICEYDSAEAFLFDWEDQPSFDVLFIDIQMGQMGWRCHGQKNTGKGQKHGPGFYHRSGGMDVGGI